MDMNTEKDDFINLERRASGVMLYTSLLETFTKFKTFEKPKNVVEVLCGTIEVFIKRLVENSPEDNQIDIKLQFIKGFKELILRLEKNV